MGPGHRQRNSDCRTLSPGGPPCCSDHVAAQDRSGKENEHAKPGASNSTCTGHSEPQPWGGVYRRGAGFAGADGAASPAVLTLDQQAERVWRQLQSMPTDLARNLSMDQLRYRNEVLYFKVLSDHLRELCRSCTRPRWAKRSSVSPTSTVHSVDCICPLIAPMALPNPSRRWAWAPTMST
jgi:hypothetical protein